MTFSTNQEVDTAHFKRVIAKAEDIIGYEFKDKDLILKALTHPSAVEDCLVECSYERLEFLGDAFLGQAIAFEVYHRFPMMAEGGLTRLKSMIVSGSTLSEVAKKLGFTDLIIFGESERGTGIRGLHSALENVYESIVAALFLDGGDKVAHEWIVKTLDGYIREDYAAHPSNPKSVLQEMLQMNGDAPEYELIAEDGPPHDRTFTMQASSSSEILGIGRGRSKKEAEAIAASNAIEKLKSRSEQV